mgnify:CR=1 FL=1
MPDLLEEAAALIILSCFSSSLLLLIPWIEVCKKKGIELPDIHKPGKPMVASLGMIPPALVSSIASILISRASDRPDLMISGVVPLLSLLIGLVDDEIGLSHGEKVVLGALPFLILAPSARCELFGLELPVWISPAWVALVGTFSSNAVNLLAGFNGVEAGLSSIASLFLAASLIEKGDLAGSLVLLSFASSCMAFLALNFYPALSFPGNSGTFFMGGFLASVALITGLNTQLLFLLSPHALDLLLKLSSWGRTIRREPSRISEDGRLLPPPHKSLVGIVLRIRPMREEELVLVLYLVEVASGFVSLFFR